MMMICSAPRRFAAMTPHSPTAPSPTTATESPGLPPATTAAWWPVPSTSDSVSSDGISASSSPTGSAKSVPSAYGTRSASAWAPFIPLLPKKPTWTQAVCRPSWQNAHVPSENANGMTTTSPRLMVRPSAPTSSTTPIASCPMDWPVSDGSIAPYGHRSLPQMQALVTRTTASVGSSILGSATSCTRTSPARYMMVARMCVLPWVEVSGVRGLRDAGVQAVFARGGLGAAAALDGKGGQRDEAERDHDDADGGGARRPGRGGEAVAAHRP